MIRYELVVVGALETNCYLVYCPLSREAVIIDPGAEPEKLFPVIYELRLHPRAILNTHGHIDHVGANRDFKEKFALPIFLHPADKMLLQAQEQYELSLLLGAKESPAPDEELTDGSVIQVGEAKLVVIHTPGHSPGSVSFLGEKLLFSGDTLFSGGVGRTDLPGGSWRDLEKSIRERILVLPEDTIVLPGHGPGTTVAEEKRSNPFFI
ncbi:MAG: MBL fold metallo-hydrolase [Candidatus Aminicenantales bacterium]